jgi:hypothetical protein
MEPDSYPGAKDVDLEHATFKSLIEFTRPPLLRIVFVGDESLGHLAAAGILWLKLDPADHGLSEVRAITGRSSFSSPELAECIAGLKVQIAYPIHRYLTTIDAPGHPFNHFRVLENLHHDVLGSYGTIYEGKVIPVYLVLPQFRDNAKALVAILDTISELVPELFPYRPKKREWVQTDEFAFGEELGIDKQIASRASETEQFIAAKREERARVAEQYDFIRRILYATEDGDKKDERLSTNIKSVLEYLDFHVTDIDEKIRGAIKKEDLWVSDGEFIAITEISATKNKNPKTKEYNDLLGRMSTIYKRRDLVPNADKVTGLLVLNYDIDTHPFKRPKVYTGQDEEFMLAAADHGIGILSTVELHRIAMAVKERGLSKEKARDLIKKPGRIEYREGEE